MHMGEAIGECEKGKKMASSSLPKGSYIFCNAEGELCAKFDGQEQAFVFTPRQVHHLDDWQVKDEGWASYGAP